jgi:hypothetical protein
MKTLVSLSTTSATGYELRIIRDDGSIDVLPIDKTYPNEPFTLVLPENPCNRKYFNSKKVDKANGSIELTYKESKTFGPRDPNATPKAPTKGWVEYLTDEEKALYEQLKAKAESRAKVAALKAQIAADQARLAELEAQA